MSCGSSCFLSSLYVAETFNIFQKNVHISFYTILDKKSLSKIKPVYELKMLEIR